MSLRSPSILFSLDDYNPVHLESNIILLSRYLFTGTRARTQQQVFLFELCVICTCTHINMHTGKPSPWPLPQYTTQSCIEFLEWEIYDVASVRVLNADTCLVAKKKFKAVGTWVEQASTVLVCKSKLRGYVCGTERVSGLL